MDCVFNLYSITWSATEDKCTAWAIKKKNFIFQSSACKYRHAGKKWRHKQVFENTQTLLTMGSVLQNMGSLARVRRVCSCQYFGLKSKPQVMAALYMSRYKEPRVCGLDIKRTMKIGLCWGIYEGPWFLHHEKENTTELEVDQNFMFWLQRLHGTIIHWWSNCLLAVKARRRSL